MKNRIFRGAGVALAVAFLMAPDVAVAAAADGDMPEVRGAKWITVAPGVATNAATAQFAFDLPPGALGADVAKATLRASALGVYEVRVNGVRPGDADEILRPGFTTWFKTRQVETFDVTDAVRRGGGSLSLRATVANSWWGDGCARAEDGVPGFLCVLEIRRSDGTTLRLVTDERWRAGWEGPVKVAGIFDGEDYDARAATGWETNLVAKAVEYRGRHGAALPKMGRGVWRRHDLALEPVAGYAWRLDDVRGATAERFGDVVKRPLDVSGDAPIVVRPGEEVVLDFGQNAAAHPEFAFRAAAAGTRLTVNCAEMLNDAGGEKARGCDGPGGSRFRRNYSRARSEINYTFAKTMTDETYRPTFTFFGYRYLTLRADAEVVVTRVRSVPVTSVLKDWERGTLATGDARVNRLVANCRWSMYSNYLSVPTDCPQRNERQGWTGDAQAFAKTAMYEADVGAFLGKWMRDMRDMQAADGAYGATAPFGCLDAYVTLHEGATRAGWFGWADAGIIVPYRVWKMGGGTKIVEENWESMKRYMAFMARKAEAFPTTVTWECADWLSFEKLESCAGYVQGGFSWKGTPVHKKWWSYLNDAYFLFDCRMMGEMAAAIGKADEAAAAQARCETVLARMRERYLDADGRLFADVRDMQAANLFALKTGLFASDARRREACETLRRSFAAHGGCLQTGFLGTSILLDTLVESGETEMAYDLLLNGKSPGWLAAVDCGATTVWEAWDSYSKERGFRKDGMLSYNHYANGAVLGWLYEKAAGIAAPKEGPLGPRLVLAPHPDRRLGSCAATLRLPQGVVKSAWSYAADGAWTWTFAIPDGVSAEVVVPGAAPRACAPGEHTVVVR